MICLTSTLHCDGPRLLRNPKPERRQKTVHHVYAQERFGALRHCEWNKVTCTGGVHDLIHEVFANRTPGESVGLLWDFWTLVQFRSGRNASEYLGGIFWKELISEGAVLEKIWPNDWRKHLWHHQRREELVGVFKRIPPWKIVRWVRRLELLTNGRVGEEAVEYLAENYWNGFVSDEWAIYQWNLVRKPPKPRKVNREHHSFHRPYFRLRTA